MMKERTLFQFLFIFLISCACLIVVWRWSNGLSQPPVEKVTPPRLNLNPIVYRYEPPPKEKLYPKVVIDRPTPSGRDIQVDFQPPTPYQSEYKP